MNGAAFFLAVNFIIAICFGAVFAVVSTRSRSRTAALWFAAAFTVASLSAVCELLVAYTSLTKFWAIGAFASVLGGMILLRIGIGELYGRKVAPGRAGCFLLASIVVDLLIYDLPRGTAAHAFSYQTPFALMLLTSAAAVFSSTRRLAIDRALGYLLVATGLHFFAKASLAVIAGAGTTAKDYIGTNYALISQSSTAVLVVAVGLTLLSVLVLEIMADERSNSEKDTLSGLANRRGFENGVKAAMALAPKGGHAVIICDLDHFKRINDTYGHHGGDLVIQAFGDLLRTRAAKNAVVGRIGGEEFAIFLPNTTLDMATLFAQALRGGTMEITVSALPSSFAVTASFGVAELAPGDALAGAMRDADAALYQAKRSGRNRVKQARPAGYPEPAAINAHK
ncbi:diguanylate cyclase (GGDEF)-like protein [Neorhizobium sp. 2083]|uniref:GGDEF domain-containing protein n=1 Tax=Neorhizobium sp. 2083 TaxID=2817762 RepID=UPI000DE06CB3|nr:GGDEF domain-containing protein [Neorhizobium sp. 2083]MDR6818800.1 diguanylate cyclase (GGDEF)-like protein [Neorhizobium sp. 2083]